MAGRRMVTMDGNEAVASVAHRINEVIAIYPITPSSNMGEWADEWSAKGMKNIWGTVPSVTEMQSEGGAALGLHLGDGRDRPPDVLHPLRRPLVGPLAHVGRGGDRVDRDHLVDPVGDRGDRLVAVHRHHSPARH